MRRSIVAVVAVIFVVLAGSLAVWAKKDTSEKAQKVDEARFSGFLNDYSKLEPNPEIVTDLIYTAPGGMEKVRRADSIMVDQPEIFIHPDSKYQGMKPDDMKVLSDAFREIMINELKETFSIVEEAGPNVLYFRMAITGLYLKKKHTKNPLAYTPIGLVTQGVKKAVTRDITKKISLVEANIEAALMMSQTGERLGAMVLQRGVRKDKEKGQKEAPTSWDDLEVYMQRAGTRLGCRLENAHLPEGERIDCLERLRLQIAGE